MTFCCRQCTQCGARFLLGHQKSVLRAVIFVTDARCNFLEARCPRCGRAMRLFEPPRVIQTLSEEVSLPIKLFASPPDELCETRDIVELRAELEGDADCVLRADARRVASKLPEGLPELLPEETAYQPTWPDRDCPHCAGPFDYFEVAEARVWVSLTWPALSYVFAICLNVTCRNSEGMRLFLPASRLAELSRAGVKTGVFSEINSTVRRRREEHCRMSRQNELFRAAIEGIEEGSDDG